MGGLGGSDSEVFQDKFHKYLRMIDEHLNSDSIDKPSGQADVYDGEQV